jgi:transposase
LTAINAAMDIVTFDAQAEIDFRKFYESLNEKDARRFAGSLYRISGSLQYICQILGISEKTVKRGLDDICQKSLPCPDRQRIKGGGRPAKWDDKELNVAFKEVIEPYVAGDPMNLKIKWTNLSRAEIAELLLKKGFKITKNTVKKLLKHNGFKKRKIQKRKSMKQVKDRDAQFNEINQARDDFSHSGDPVISVDTKKKEAIGDNARSGESYATGQMNGPDHTFSNLDVGKAVPHGIYDIANNQAYIHIGKSGETAKFIVDSIILWWENYGCKLYPKARRILMLFDAGGANSCRHHVFKSEIQRLANSLKIEVVIKHYPPYASKWNPIEHRVFCHVARVIKGVFIRTFDTLKSLVSRAKTKTGLQVTVNDIDGDYETGLRGKKEDWEGSIKLGDILPEWNYACSPVF